jgi:Uma2 family endonuclease
MTQTQANAQPTDSPIQVDGETISFEDFLKKYDGVRAEWIVGRVEVHVTNNVAHQMILLFLSGVLNTYLEFRTIGKLLLAGIVMYLGEDRPGREPDLMVVLNEHLDRIHSTRLNGTADIAIEIVSPESVERDYGKKFIEYEEAGVSEYWLFDPLRQVADIYVLTEVEEEGKTVYRYFRAKPDEAGHIKSTLLPDFALDPTILWRDELPGGKTIYEMVQNMIGER